MNVSDGSTQSKPRRIEIYSQAVNKAIDAQLQTQHQLVDAERDRLLKQHFLDQMVILLAAALFDVGDWFENYKIVYVVL